MYLQRIVGLSNILDSLIKELNRREKSQMAHGDMVSALIVSSQLGFEIFKRIELSFIIEPFLIFSMAPFHFSFVSGGIGSDGFIMNTFRS